jgi:hypothetical protein
MKVRIVGARLPDLQQKKFFADHLGRVAKITAIEEDFMNGAVEIEYQFMSEATEEYLNTFCKCHGYTLEKI